MTPEEIDALTLGGYLPFDCPRCDRRRLEFFLNSDGGLCYCKCEKCGANSEDDSLSSTRRSQPYQAGFYQAGDAMTQEEESQLLGLLLARAGGLQSLTLAEVEEPVPREVWMPKNPDSDECEGPDECDAHHPCRKHAEANAGRFQQR